MIESDLLRHIYTRSSDLSRFGQVVIGPGDDCAVLQTPSGDHLLLTVDQVVEGRHFDPVTDPSRSSVLDGIARKAVARSISDIAAMGGTPTATLATACLPPGFPQSCADELFDRMHAWALHWGSPLIGGDIAMGPDLGSAAKPPLLVTTTVLGVPHAGRGPVLRSTARVGDELWVTGRLGNSFASGRHMTFEPRVAEARWLCSRAGAEPTAMIDLSDGLGRDADRIARASHARIEIDAQLLPLHPDCADWRRGVSDGEDYELLFTLPPGSLTPGAAAGSTPLTRIGEVVAGPPGAVIRTDTGLLDASGLGWDHTDRRS